FVSRLSFRVYRVALPDVAEDFAADAGLDGGPAGHHAARRRQDAGAEPREHFRHVVAPEVDAAAGTADALDARDEPLAVRAVLEEQAQRLAGARPAVGLVEHFEARDVALVLQDARDVGLDARRRHVHTRVLRDDGVANPSKHVRDRICHSPDLFLPAALGDARDITFQRQFPEAQTAERELAHVGARTAAEAAAVAQPD